MFMGIEGSGGNAGGASAGVSAVNEVHSDLAEGARMPILATQKTIRVACGLNRWERGASTFIQENGGRYSWRVAELRNSRNRCAITMERVCANSSVVTLFSPIQAPHAPECHTLKSVVISDGPSKSW